MPRRMIDITGQKFGQLTVMRFSHISSHGQTMYLVRCACGAEKIVRAGNLRSGQVKSCGCLEGNHVHGHSPNGKPSPTYNSWRNMINRCSNPKHKLYKHYGGSGVKVCDRWLKFENFLADMGERPPGMTLGRFGDIGDYFPQNCMWMTWTEQGAEKKKKHMVQKVMADFRWADADKQIAA